MNRFEELHFCPLFETRAATPAFATSSRCVVCATINASLPPSSSTEGFKYFPASAPMERHAHSEPVRLTPRISFRESIYSLSLEDIMIF